MPVHLNSATAPRDVDSSLRRYPRTLFSAPITLRHLCRGGVRTTRGMSLDLGEGGLGALVQGDVQVGETVAIDLRLNTGWCAEIGCISKALNSGKTLDDLAGSEIAAHYVTKGPTPPCISCQFVLNALKINW